MKRFKNINSTIKASTLYMVGNFFNKAVAFFMVPVFTRLLSTSEYGIVNTYASWVSMFTIILSVSLSATIRMAYFDYKENIDRYMTSISFLVFIFFSVSLGLCGVYYAFGTNKFLGILVIFCIVQSYATFLQNLEINKLMMDFAYVKRTLLMTLPNILSIVVALIVLLSTSIDRSIARVFPEVIIQSIFGIIILVTIYKKDNTLVDTSIWKYGLALSIPLVFHSLSTMILASFDRTMITALRNSHETGIYSTAYNFGMIVTALSTALDGVWFPWFAKKMNNDDQSTVNKIERDYIFAIVIIVCAIMLVAPDIMRLMTPQSYWSGASMIPPIVFASFIIFLISFVVNAEYYYKKTKHIGFNTFVAAIVNVGLNYILIPKYGATVAAWTTVVAYLVSLVMHLVNVKKINKQLFPLIDFVLSIIVVICCCVVVILLDNYMIIRFCIVGVLGVWFLVKYLPKFKNMING